MVALVAVLALAAACGGDDDESATTAGVDTPTTSQATESSETTAAGEPGATEATDVAATTVGSETPASGTPIKVGVIADITGPFNADFDFAVEVAEAWTAYTNDNGGVAGRPVELVIKDTKGDSATATSFANELVEDDSIAAIFLADESTSSIVAPLLSAAKLPVIGAHGYAPDVWSPDIGLPYVYGVVTTYPVSASQGAAIVAKEVGATVWMTVLCGEVPVCAEAEPLFKAATDEVGLENAGLVQALGSAADYTALCLSVIEKGADFIYLATASAVGVRIAKDCRTQGYEGWIGMGNGAAIKEVLADLDHVTGPLNAFPWFVDAPPVQRYRDIMAAQSVPEESWSNVLGTSGFTTMEMFKTAIEAAAPDGDVTRETVVTAYSNVKDETLGGLLPSPVTYTDGGKPPAISCFWSYVKDDGTITGSFTPACYTP